jgi:hypothetical protein
MFQIKRRGYIASLFLLSMLFLWTLSPVVAQDVYALNRSVLSQVKKRVQSKQDPLQPAYQRLLNDAEKALQFKPVSVMEKTQVPPSGDKHDYMSIAPYHWPNPDTKDGLPYIRKDGQTNPEVNDFKDKEYLPTLCEQIYVLGLSYYFSGEERFARHATELLRVWFLNPSTKMNPNLNFGQAVKGVNTGRGSGLIDTRHFVKLIDGIGLLKPSQSWTAADQAGMQQWFTAFLQWMETSKIGMEELQAGNNHGVWFDAQRLSMALFTGQQQHALSIIDHALGRLDQQMAPNGRFPREMERTISLHYNVFVIDAFILIANMAETMGKPIWKTTTPKGNSLQKAIDTFVPYVNKTKPWDGPQIKPYPDHESTLLLATAASQYGYQKAWKDLEMLNPDQYKSLRIHLLTPSH